MHVYQWVADTHTRTHARTHTHKVVTGLAFTVILSHHASIIAMAKCNVAWCDFTDSAVSSECEYMSLPGYKVSNFPERACPQSPSHAFLKTIFHPKVSILDRTLTTFIGVWKCLLDTGGM